jgi:uncharacterized protein (DUF1330 family)
MLMTVSRVPVACSTAAGPRVKDAPMAKGYIVFTEAVHDQDGMNEYSAKAAGTIFPAGGKPLVASAPDLILEGDWHGSQTVILEFPSIDEAMAWYEGEAYQTVIGERLAASECNVAVFPGLDF